MQPVPLDSELANEQRHQARLHQPGAQRIQHDVLEHLPADGAVVVTHRLHFGGVGGQVVPAAVAEHPAAAPAEQLAGLNVLRAGLGAEVGAVRVVGARGVADGAQAALHLLPGLPDQ